jgi:hypothetical protein
MGKALKNGRMGHGIQEIGGMGMLMDREFLIM